jgi:23S rRNA-/tRNA-specific pseudouridylate synthase
VLAQYDGLTLLEVQPVTGRTHQIRAHLAAYGYGIVGDQVYGQDTISGTVTSQLRRQFLHAYSLTLRCYPDGIIRTFVAPLADDLMEWMRHYFSIGAGVIDARAVPAQ